MNRAVLVAQQDRATGMDIRKIRENTVIDCNGCWIWNKSCTSAGYGQLTENRKYWTAHRYAWHCTNGFIRHNSVIRHMCGNRKCCNPDHLKEGSHRDNYFDSYSIHKKAMEIKRKIWIINGERFSTLREASFKTKISQTAIIKHTIDGVFNIESYRTACRTAAVKPKV